MEKRPPPSPPLSRLAKRKLRVFAEESSEASNSSAPSSFDPSSLLTGTSTVTSFAPNFEPYNPESLLIQHVHKSPPGHQDIVNIDQTPAQELPESKSFIDPILHPETNEAPEFASTPFQPPADVLFALPQETNCQLSTLLTGVPLSQPPTEVQSSLFSSNYDISSLRPQQQHSTDLNLTLEQFLSKPPPLPEFAEREPDEEESPSQENVQTSFTAAANERLYPGYENAPLVHEGLVTLLTFATSVRLSYQDFSELLQMQDVLLPQPNNLPKTNHLFFKRFEDDESELQVFYFCTSCWKQRSSLKDICPDCKDPNKKVTYFLICPLIPQLQKIYSKPGFREKINYKNTRQKQCAENVEDIYDTTVYKEAEKTVLKNKEEDVTLQWYTDGVSLYEVSSYTLWPFVFIINELPLEERYRPENIILGGFWGCHDKPHPNVFLLPIYHELSKVSKGFTVKFHEAGESIVSAHLLNGTCDTPARSTFMNMKGHAGFESCPRCFIKGEKSTRTKMVMVFPHEETLEPRNQENYEECVQQSLTAKDDYRGVIGPTILSYMTVSDFISSVSIDGMHCCYLGCGKQICKLLFDPHYSSEKFSLSQKIPIVNARLFSLRLPHFVQRLPVGVDKLAYWKASLFRNFILYFFLPVMKDLMKPEYYDHISLLVQGLRLLNSDSISDADFDDADRLLCQFCDQFQDLYGIRHMSYNLHLLRHLSQSVKDTGNLFISGCFPLEDLNGKMAKQVHGTTHAPLQIHKRFLLAGKLKPMIENMTSPSLKNFCNNLMSNSRYVKLDEKISCGIYVAGSLEVDTPFKKIIEELIDVQFQTFGLLFKHKILYGSVGYEEGSRRSYYCKYNCNETIVHGKILTFVKVSPNVKYFALIVRSVFNNTSGLLPCYFEDIDFPGADIDLIPVQQLITVCFCINVKDRKYVIDPLNSHELE